jgi:flagellar basal body-associated protein FliL
MNKLVSRIERYMDGQYRTEIVLSITVLVLLCLGVIGYFLFRGQSPQNNTADEEWTAEQKEAALEDLHSSARKAGVPLLSDAEKMRIMESVSNGTTP